MRELRANMKLLLQLINKRQRLKDTSMPEATAILEVDGPHCTVRLYEKLLKADLMGSLKNEIEEALENKPILAETIGGVLSIFVPLHIRLSDINSANVDETGKLKIDLPHRRNILIPLERKDAQRLVDKLNELVTNAKKQEVERITRKRAPMLKRRARKHARAKRVPPSSYITMPYRFPTEQVDNVPKLQPRKKRKMGVR
jgi:hypothetical protein